MAASIPVAGLAFYLAVGRRDGISLDRWLSAWLRHRRAPRRLVPAEGPVAPPPPWAVGSGSGVVVPSPLRLPARGVDPDGLIDLGPDGTTALVTASTVAFGLRSPAEQNGLVGAFARWLHSLDGPAQILVRAERVDLGYLADRILDAAPALPHPALEGAARDHAAFLDDLAGRRELLHRQVTVAVRSRRSPGHTAHQANETVRALSGCQVPATVLDADATRLVLAGCLDPHTTTPAVGRREGR
jgi:hypothetical protein